MKCEMTNFMSDNKIALGSYVIAEFTVIIALFPLIRMRPSEPVSGTNFKIPPRNI